MIKPIHSYEVKFREFLKEGKDKEDELKEASVQVKQVNMSFKTGTVRVKAVMASDDLLAIYHKDIDGKPFRFSVNLSAAQKGQYSCVANEMQFYMDKKIIDEVVNQLT